MKIALRAVASLVVFLVVGWMAEHIILEHAHVRTPGYGPEVLLAAHTAGLFAGGFAAVIILIALLMFDSNAPRD